MTDTSAPLNSLALISFSAKTPPRAVPQNATAVVRLPPATALDPAGHSCDQLSSSGLNACRPCPRPCRRQPNQSCCGSLHHRSKT